MTDEPYDGLAALPEQSDREIDGDHARGAPYMIAGFTYTLSGFLIGLCFPLCTLLFSRVAGGAMDTTSFSEYATQAHIAQPLYYLVDMVPVLLGLLGFLAGSRQDRTTNAASALRREDRKKSDALARVAGDLESRRRWESQVAQQVFQDPLTHLANRALFVNRTEHALARAGSKKDEIAVLLLDLDDFKTINDALGHAEGDTVLVAVAQRLSALIRPSDTLARLAGDEFALLLDRGVHVPEAVEMAQRLIDAMALPLTLSKRQVRIGLSVGIASGRSDSGAEAMLRDAGLAMDEAKARGKSCLRVFRPAMRQALLERVKLSGDLQRALQREQFYLMYQPIVSLTSQRITGIEALVRWKHPKRGAIPPLEFIKLAEETNVIAPLGTWILNAACRQAVLWQAGRPAENPLTVTVNVSPLQLQQPSFVADVRAAIVASSIDPANLVLEITESALVDDTAENIAVFVELKALGIRLAIDDFGTGYSSLSYLQRFPFDIIKIDKSFIDGVAGNGTDVAFARTIIALGGMLKLRLVAEGIEHATQLAKLKELGCEYGQGFLFAKPLDSAGMTALLAASPGLPAPPLAA